MTYVALFVVAVLAVMAFLLLAWWGGAIVLVLGVAFVLYLAAARRENPSVGTIETGRREPTGRTRSGSAGAETANERVGQD
jgi:hypothetical protein